MTMNPTIAAGFSLAGRCLLALLFLIDAWITVNGYAGALAYTQKFGLPGFLLPGAIALQLVGGLLIVIGWQTRRAAIALAGFCLMTAFIFHANIGQSNELLHFLKDLAIAGGFLLLAVNGPGEWSVDERAK